VNNDHAGICVDLGPHCIYGDAKNGCLESVANEDSTLIGDVCQFVATGNNMANNIVSEDQNDYLTYNNPNFYYVDVCNTDLEELCDYCNPGDLYTC
jgi:hypothetical protein